MSFARVMTVQIQPAKLDEAVEIYRNSVVPAAREQAGQERMVLVTDRASGKGVSIWETEAALRASEASGYLQTQLGKFAPVLAAPPVRELFEVAVWEKVSGNPTHARIITVQIKGDKLDDAISTYGEIVRAAKEQPGFSGALLLVDRATGKGMSATAWRSEAELQASESSGYLREQLAKFSPLFTAPPVQETYELTVRV